MTRHLYFAYGSNMFPAQMRSRCPSARVFCVAALPEHELVFRGYSGRWDGSVASVEPKRRSRVSGLLWSVSSADLSRLDAFEGHPTVYERRAFAVQETETGEPWCAWSYVHVLGKRTHSFSPSAEYLETIRRGYLAAGINPRALERAARSSK